MLSAEINITNVIDLGYAKIVSLGATMISRRRNKKDYTKIAIRINNITEGIGYLESDDVIESDKLKIAKLLIEIGDLRNSSTGIFKGDISTNAETTS